MVSVDAPKLSGASPVAEDIILTQPGLSAIFDAVVESRKIFARLRSYVLQLGMWKWLGRGGGKWCCFGGFDVGR